MRGALSIAIVAVTCLGHTSAIASTPIDDLNAVASMPGEPSLVSAAGVTRSEAPLLTLENPAAFDPASTRLRLVIVGGLDGEEQSAQAVLAAVRWLKRDAPTAIRNRWIVSALPMADPDGHTKTRRLQFPPVKGFYEDAEQPESRYLWRWVAYQAPDLVIEIRSDAASGEAPDSLTMALRDGGTGPGSTPAAVLPASASHAQWEQALSRATGRSPLHQVIAQRIARQPIEVARLLAERYPATPSISYIPALAWINTLKLSALTGDNRLRTRVMTQVEPWQSGTKSLLGDRIQLTTVAGTMVFAEIAKADPANAAARALAIEGAEAALKEKAGGQAQYGQGWTDDMFMASAILARTTAMPGREHDLDRAAQLLIAYATRLQQPDGIFNHATDGPAAWGRGNGFAAFGLMETLTVMPSSHPSRQALLDIFARQMKGVAAWQAPDGMWREVIDRPGAYREETATAMILTAMARGVRLGWIDRSYTPIVDRAWRALAAHITADGGLVDVCSGTGAGPTVRYYYDRPAVEGTDDRGGAMAMVAAMERLATR
ncbi:MAG TPA: glycoside hydrolase family 88 protein [Vicinamibacterales bacterium]|jgi:rhamnogalacturonyl hydrolase YesR